MKGTKEVTISECFNEGMAGRCGEECCYYKYNGCDFKEEVVKDTGYTVNEVLEISERLKNNKEKSKYLETDIRFVVKEMNDYEEEKEVSIAFMGRHSEMKYRITDIANMMMKTRQKLEWQIKEDTKRIASMLKGSDD